MSLQLITRPVGETFIVIRSSYLAICNGNTVAAGLIHIFEQWHIYKAQEIEQTKKANAVARRHNEPPPYAETLLQWHTTADLERQLMGLGKKDAIQAARRQLVGLGVVSEHKNPNPKYAFDNTTFYLFHPEQVNQLVDLAEQRKTVTPVAETSQPSAENRERSAGNRHYTYNTSNKPANEPEQNTAAAGDGPQDPGKNSKKVNRKNGAGPRDTEWQRWVDAWHNFVKARIGIPPLITGAQVGALKKLRAHLVSVAQPVKGSENGTPDDHGFGAWSYILENWGLLEPWLQNQLDLTLVLKKINDILNQLRNGTTNTNRGNNSSGHQYGAGTSASRVDAIRNY